ncbi:flagellin N-terminal-like domain-containing protein [Natronoarchaeum philippinense]|uniref:Flagellin N-terminal-like domain-containing protein n=1 Tax=Natronoarchaeum philippinense TaxID=558529 RepID=A0A285NT40_NATPI|nr:archaellin/type IV pilin N-terminal domain-containing protein [Natronoarchaeum philippinense]SNZ12635.1 flagellin N-terminal-like domain-containing protein [Natronoarchaeum philippinense]
MSRSERSSPNDRAQSNVVGVALLLAIAVVGLGGLTAGIGAVVESNAATADAASVADGFDRALQPTETTGYHEGRVAFANGRIATEDRALRVLNESGVVATVAVDALVYESGDRRVAYEAGTIVRGRTGNSWLYEAPPITASRGSGGVLAVGAAQLNASEWTTTGAAGRSLRLSSRVSHDRRALGNGSYRVAIETPTPGAWKRHFDAQSAVRSTSGRLFPGDDHQSVVATYRGDRTAYLIIHDMQLEVNRA